MGYVLIRGGGQAVQGGLSCPPPRISERMDNIQILLHHLLQKYLVERDVNFISVSLRCLLQTFSRVTYWQGVGGQAVQCGLSSPPPWISERIDNKQLLVHHLLQEYLVERNVNFISVNQKCLLQTFSWVTYWQGVGGQAVQGGLSCPPPRISERMDNPQILLHHLLQKYLVERDIKFTEMLTSNVHLGCVLTRGWGQAFQGGFSCPPLRISERIDNMQILLHHLLQEYSVERDINFTEMLTSNVQLGCVLTRGGGQAVQGGLSCPLLRISERKDDQQILLHQILQEYLVERDINFISVNLGCLLQMFSWVTYWQGVGGKLSRAVYLAPCPEFEREWTIRKFYYTIYYRNI